MSEDNGLSANNFAELQSLIGQLSASLNRLSDRVGTLEMELENLSSDCQSNWEDTTERGDFLDLKETVEDLQYRLSDVEQLLEERNEK